MKGVCLTPVRIRYTILLAALFAASYTPIAFGQPGAAWRFWNTADGFVESYTSSAALSPDGAVWLKHGSSGPVERMDGYFAPRFPDPGKLGTLAGSPGGAVWMWGGDELKRFHNGAWAGWKIDQVSEFGPEHSTFNLSWDAVSRASPALAGTISIVGRDSDHALILLPDRVLEFDANRGSAQPILWLRQTGLRLFVAMVRGSDGGVIVSGRGGWGRLSPALPGRDAGGAWSWTRLPQPPEPWVEFDFPLEIPGENLFLTGVSEGETAEALTFDGKAWKALYRGQGRIVRAFPGVDGTVWVQDGNNLVELAGGRRLPANKTGVLSGIVLSISPESSGRFWVVTSEGAARAAPALWRTPPDSPPVDDVVNSIAEDRHGNVWFLDAHSLIRFDNSSWKSWPLPKGETAWAIFTDGLQALPDGRIVVRVTADHLLVFDPARDRFNTVPYPPSKVIRMITGGPGGLVLAEALDTVTRSVSLDLFDGGGFRPFASPEQLGRKNELRSVVLSPQGDIYLGGVSSFGVSHQGSFRALGARDGFTDPGAFSIFRDHSGRIYAGGRDSLFESEGSKWRVIQTGLDRVRQVLRSRDGTLWVASGTGVHRWRNGIWLTNGEEEGLPSGVAYNVFEDSRGRIWAGTTRGLSLFHPEADPDPPVVQMEDDQNPREAPPGGKIRLAFTGVDKWKLTPVSRLLFSWRLDGGRWSAFAPRSSVSFDRLGPGAHRIEVRGMDRNGNISLDPAAHQFSVLVPWYATTGFQVLAALALVLIVFFFTIALMSYRHRGRLIDALNQRNKLERQRQKILQMIANRRPLPEILATVTRSVAEHCAGGTCLLVIDHDVERVDGYEIHCTPQAPEGFLERVRTPGSPSWKRPRNREEWRNCIQSAVEGYFAPEFQVLPVSPPEGDSSSILAVLYSGEPEISDSRKWLLEIFANLAAAAIENSRLYRELAYQARHDALTGLPNRAAFEEELSYMVGSSGPGDEFAVLYLDLDRFKEVNDTLGHRVGDFLLRQVALRLSGELKSAGRLFRIGGDEFIILAPATEGRRGIERLASNLLRSLDPPVLTGGNELYASASIGVSFFRADGETSSVLQKNADIAMYRAKAKGRNGFELFTSQTSESGADQSLEQTLRFAEAEGRFQLKYQPRFTPSGRVKGFEAMLQLLHPKRGPVDAHEFVPVAEESGLIVPIGHWVLREICHQLAEWKAEGLGEISVAVNISPLEIVRTSYAAEVEAILAETGVPPRMIRIELTESTLIANLAECAKQMSRLRALGIGLSLDDFGVGYSPVSWLQALPVDALKVDLAPPLLDAVAAMGRSLGLALIVKHIGTPDRLSAASTLLNEENGVLQGDLLSAPLAASEARRLLEPEMAGFAYLEQTEPHTDSSLSIASEHCSVVTP